MRNMLAFLAAVTLTVISVGWYLDWFQLRSVPADTGHRSWTVDMNTEKIGKDLMEAESRIQKKIEDKNKKADTTSHPAKSDAAVKPIDGTKQSVGATLRKIGEALDQPQQ